MNSIPLIKGNTPQEINTSIIALKKALSELEAQDRLLHGTDKDVQDKIKQINELIEGINTHLGTVDTHLTTIDGQITALQPVDTVTSGNMQSVTSNAVANALGISETEVSCGVYFGGTKYKKSFIYSVSTVANTGVIVANNFEIPWNKIVGFDCFIVNQELVSDCTLYVQNVNGVNQLCIFSPHTATVTVVATVYYIKD